MRRVTAVPSATFCANDTFSRYRLDPNEWSRVRLTNARVGEGVCDIRLKACLKPNFLAKKIPRGAV